MAKVKLSQASYDELLEDIEELRLQSDTYFEQWQEAKKKAEAWIDLKTEMIEMYPVLVVDAVVTSGEWQKGMLYQLGKHLRHMDELDGTNDFKNLLSDLEEQ
ncbi:hypothetical protein H3923_10060 [Staphylococcus hominis]|uniref:hypothetical protein n=1 Tax=Staphylococcus hominis TaxID=1290 RepID=UPI001887351E|nr:hypothetical protein [Staphylococcus hominis]MBF2319448.1 hypothetical protein [Staphylococcus hominis]